MAATGVTMAKKRAIKPAMVKWLDEKLASNGLAQHAIKTKNPRLLLVEAAKACVGIREATNRNDGPMVELIQSTVGGANREAWCLSFVQTMVAYVELRCKVVSKLGVTEHCQTLWAMTPASMRVKRMPLPGAIPIWAHYSFGKKTSNGHTGLTLGADEKKFLAVEGNTTSGQTASGKVVREGGGVYFTERAMQGFPKISGNASMRLVGFIIPF